MMAAAPVVQLDDLQVETPSAWSAGLSTFTSERKNRSLRPDRRGRILGRAELLDRIARAQYVELLESRLRQVVLPDRFTAESILEMLKVRDLQPEFREIKKKLDSEAARIAEVWEDRSRQSSVELVQDGRENLREEILAFRRRSRLLLVQRARHYNWVMICLVRGNLASAVAAEIARAFLWEAVQIRLSETVLFPSALESTSHSKSRRELDNVIRELHRAIQAQGSSGDLAMVSRERLMLFIDSWNSETLGDIYGGKSWRSEPLDSIELTRLVQRTKEATDTLSAAVNAQYGRDRVEGILEPDASDLQLASGLFTTLLEEDYA